MKGESSSMCIAFSILMLGYNIILSVGIHVVCQDLGQQNPGGIHGGIPTRDYGLPQGGIPGGILPRIGWIPTGIMACLRWDPAWDPTQDWRDPGWNPTRGVP